MSNHPNQSKNANQHSNNFPKQPNYQENPRGTTGQLQISKNPEEEKFLIQMDQKGEFKLSVMEKLIIRKLELDKQKNYKKAYRRKNLAFLRQINQKKANGNLQQDRKPQSQPHLNLPRKISPNEQFIFRRNRGMRSGGIKGFRDNHIFPDA